jgi:preprotein translocase subunit YajC
MTLLEMLDFFKKCHRNAPFLFFNGNTFADVARQIVVVIFAELPAIRRREVTSAVAHYVAGVLDREAMMETVDTLWKSASLQEGDRVRTLRGSLHGKVIRILEDGRVVWRPDDATHNLTGLPESLTKEE